MDLKELVELNSVQTANGIKVDIFQLLKTPRFRELVVAHLLEYSKDMPYPCIIFPDFQRHRELGTLINDLAMEPQIKMLLTDVTPCARAINNLCNKDVIIVNLSFRHGVDLDMMIDLLKSMGCNVRVLCLLATSKNAVTTFAKENKVEMTSLIYQKEE